VTSDAIARSPWQRATSRCGLLSDLTAKEQKAVRTALRFLRLRVGAWGPLAKALRYQWDSIQKVATGKKAVTPTLALRVARFAGVPMDELLAGQWLSPRSARTAVIRRTISSTRAAGRRSPPWWARQAGGGMTETDAEGERREMAMWKAYGVEPAVPTRADAVP
jgi:plasmid maintenance system antidote protein VapI